jgi:hypothetical protein
MCVAEGFSLGEVWRNSQQRRINTWDCTDMDQERTTITSSSKKCAPTTPPGTNCICISRYQQCPRPPTPNPSTHSSPQQVTLWERGMSLSSCYAIKLTQVKLPRAEKRRRKRSQEGEAPLHSQKRPRASHPRSTLEDTIGKNAVVGVRGKEINPVEYWTHEFCWPKEYFQSESRMSHQLARKKLFRRKQTDASSGAPSSTTPSEPKSREAKSSPYARPSYETVLATKGSFMSQSELGITDKSKRLCRTLLEAKQLVPQDTLFCDDLFEKICERVRPINEAQVVLEISPRICPSALVLTIYGFNHLKLLNESVNGGWTSATPYCGPCPQPDYSVGLDDLHSQMIKLKSLRLSLARLQILLRPIIWPPGRYISRS